MITNVPFSQTNPGSGSARNSPSLAGEITNLNNEVGTGIEDTIIQGYVQEAAAVNFLSNNSFSVSGNVTPYYTAGRLLRLNRASTPIYVTVLSSSFGVVTTVTIRETTVPNPLNSVDLAIQPKGFTSNILYSPQINYPTVKSPIATQFTDADGATITFDMNVAQIHTVTVGVNGRTLALANVNTWQAFLVRIIQGGAGGLGVNWWTTINWPSTTPPALSNGAGLIDVFGFLCTAPGVYDGYILGLGL